MKGRLREETLYPRVEKFLKARFGCKWTFKKRGSEDVGQVDVVGVRSFKDVFSNRYEVIVVEVKPYIANFGKMTGQTIGYSLLAHRVYLACRDEFTISQVELASKLGIGLIQIKKKAGCSEVLGSDVFQPDKEKMLKLLDKMWLAECSLCGAIVDQHGETKKLSRAVEKGVPFLFQRQINSEYSTSFKGRSKTFSQYLFVCPECVKLFGQKSKV